MGKTTFQNIIIIGYGKIAGEILKAVDAAKADYGFTPMYIEHEVYPFHTALEYAKSHDIPFYRMEKRESLHDYLASISSPALIVSAGNNYLFPEDIVCKDNFQIINFHNALLPDYPGRNAPSWAIYNKEKITGITWHFVTAEVDAGSVIAQKNHVIGDDEKAYELADHLMSLAAEAFREFFPKLLEGNLQARPQKLHEKRKLYRACEVPGDGKFSCDDDPADIYRLLRALDYGKAGIFPSASAALRGKTIKVTRYKKVLSAEAGEKPGILFLPLGGSFLKLAYTDSAAQA